jgi:hypothetical protein
MFLEFPVYTRLTVLIFIKYTFYTSNNITYDEVKYYIGNNKLYISICPMQKDK